MKKIVLVVMFLGMVVSGVFGLGMSERVIPKNSSAWQFLSISNLLEQGEQKFTQIINENVHLSEGIKGTLKLNVEVRYGYIYVTITGKPENHDAIHIISRESGKQYFWVGDNKLEIRTLPDPNGLSLTAPYDLFGALDKEINYSILQADLDTISDESIESIDRIAFGATKKSSIEVLTKRKLNTSVIERIVLPFFGKQKYDFIILIEGKDSDDVYFEHFTFTALNEQFPGEGSIVSDDSNWEALDLTGSFSDLEIYNSKALNILGTHLFIDPYEVLAGYGDTSAWFNIENKFSPNQEMRFKDLERYLEILPGDGNNIAYTFSNALKQLLSKNIVISNEERFYDDESIILPYLSFRETDFKALYGKFQPQEGNDAIERNIYISPYLEFLFDKDGNNNTSTAKDELHKPVLSNLFRKAYLEADIEIPYDYGQYRTITPDEGQLMANAALKYLTWGVEYTPYQSASNYIIANPDNMVFDSNLAAIEEWIGVRDGDSDQHLEANYFPGISGKIDTDNEDRSIVISSDDTSRQIHDTSVRPNHVFEGAFFTDRLTFAANRKEGEKLSFTKVDLWSAKNYSWDRNIIDTIQINGESVTNYKQINDVNIHSFETFYPVGNKLSISTQLNSALPVGGLLVIGDIGNEKSKTISITENGVEKTLISREAAFKDYQEATKKFRNLVQENKFVISGSKDLEWKTIVFAKKYSHDNKFNTAWSSELKKDQWYSLKYEKTQDVRTIRIKFFRAGGTESKYKITLTKGEESTNICDSEIATIYNGEDELVLKDGFVHGIKRNADVWIVLKDFWSMDSIKIEDHTEKHTEAGWATTEHPYGEGFGIFEIQMYAGSFTKIEDMKHEIKIAPYFDEYIVDDSSFEYVRLGGEEDIATSSKYHYFILSNTAIKAAKQIQIDIPTEASVNIHEFLIFDSDPISYVTGTRQERVDIANIYDTKTFTHQNIDYFSNWLVVNDLAEYHKKNVGLFLVSNQDFTKNREYIGVVKDPTENWILAETPSYVAGDTSNVIRYGIGQTNVLSDNRAMLWELEDHDRSKLFTDFKWTWTQSHDNWEGFYVTGNAWGSSGMLYDFVNENPIPIINDKCVFTLDFRKNIPINTIVVWENGAESALKDEFRLFIGDNDNLINIFLQSTGGGDVVDALELTSPYTNSDNEVVRGNPLPYLAKGIDSPRTFAYKMWEQWRARKWYITENSNDSLYVDNFDSSINSTKAIDKSNFENYRNSYLTEIDVVYQKTNTKLTIDTGSYGYNEDYPEAFNPPVWLEEGSEYADFKGKIKPFLPQLSSPTREGYVLYTEDYELIPSMYNSDKLAGVDSLGLLSGALAIADVKVLDAFNRNIPGELQSYFAMETGTDTPGLDEEGRPAFYVQEGESYLDGNYRFYRSDIERNSVIVPDISYIKVGDILVRNDTEGDFHVGIVVHLDWDEDNIPQFGDAAEDWWDKVWVISTRKGFETVNIGTWGSNGNIFNGFTEESEAYHIRRLLVKKDDSTFTHRDRADSWELVDKVATKIYNSYPSDDVIPLWYHTYIGYNNLGFGEDVIKLKDENLRFYKELPATSIDGYDPQFPILGKEVPLYLTQNSGWRDYRHLENPMNFTSYHRGLDIVSGNWDTYKHSIYAPNDGIFYFITANSQKAGELKYSEEDDVIYSFGRSYGVVGVFISLNGSDEFNRIYVFAHQGAAGQTETQAIESFFKEQFDLHYPGKEFPSGFEEAISVKAGDWIGMIGNNGLSTGNGAEGSGAHIHQEIWEKFEDIGDTGRSGWRRVDPLKTFPVSWYMNPSGYDSASIVESDLKTVLDRTGESVEPYFKPDLY